MIALKLGGKEVFKWIDRENVYDRSGETEIVIPEEGHYYAWTGADVTEVKEYTDFSEDPYGEFDDMKYDSIMDLGRLDKGCKVTLKADNDEKMHISLYRLDVGNMQSLTDDLMKETLTITDFSEDHIEGVAEITEGRELLLAMPISADWEIWLDGNKKLEPGSFYGLFIKLTIPPGIHHISLTYHIPYFGTGLLISVLSLLASLACIMLYLKHSRW
jgi:uncharacterized membrane protein YfhO